RSNAAGFSARSVMLACRVAPSSVAAPYRDTAGSRPRRRRSAGGRRPTVDSAFRHTPPSAAVRLAVRSDDATAAIEVNDDGPGIPATDLPQVFERFRRGRGATAGTGLGLALCQEIATRHHGRIALESAPGAGTRVTVTLPLAPAGG